MYVCDYESMYACMQVYVLYMKAIVKMQWPRLKFWTDGQNTKTHTNKQIDEQTKFNMSSIFNFFGIKK